MTEAWQRRSSERQELREELMHEIFSWEEKEEDKRSLFKLASAIFDYLRQRVQETPNWEMHQCEILSEFIFPKLWEFARSQEEADQIMADLFKTIQDLAIMPIYTKLQKQERENPELIFHAASAMTSVPLQG